MSQAQSASPNSSQDPPRHHKKDTRKPSGHRHTLSLQKTEITINVYDLLPPSKLSTVLWTLGTAFLHSGIAINNREYAYGGHNRRNLTGVYWTKPQSSPPGGTFKCSILQGFTLMSPSDIEIIIAEAAQEFKGTGYNLLSRNCNHFTSYLCEKLTGKPAPGWLNRAASIGVALPCVVPRDWVSPPEAEEGELVDEGESDDESTESSRMLRAQQAARHSYDEGSWREEDNTRRQNKRVTDTSGRRLPLAERAP